MKQTRLLTLLALGTFLLGLYWYANISDNEWSNNLPACPCKAPEISNVTDGWALDKGNTNLFHQGASFCIRSYPPVQTTEGMSGQQCCYDSLGRLITSGTAAGTPDRISACKGENHSGSMTIAKLGVIGHFFKDVLPFFIMDISKYHEYWPPHNGNNCFSNNHGQKIVSTSYTR